jgi:hypothetical protein
MTVRLPPANLVLDRAGKMRNVYYARIPVKHELDHVLDPDYFGELMGSKALTPGDRIECEAEDFAWDLELRVHAQNASTSQLITRVVRDYRRYDIAELPKGWTMEWLGGAEHFGIFYEGAIKDQGLVSKEACANRINAMVAKDRDSQAAREATRSIVEGQTGKKPASKAKAEAA